MVLCSRLITLIGAPTVIVVFIISSTWRGEFPDIVIRNYLIIFIGPASFTLTPLNVQMIAAIFLLLIFDFLILGILRVYWVFFGVVSRFVWLKARST